MPPKKRKPAVNPVVGTVSTRSTRRQSIVNIEIPKLTRSGKSPKALKEPKPTISVKAAEPTPSKEFALKLRKSYNKCIASNTESPPQSKISQNAVDKDNKALLEILQDWNDEDEDQVDYSTMSSGRSDIKPIINKNVDNEAKSLSNLSANKQMELMLSEGLEDEEVLLDKTKDDFKIVQDDSHSGDFEAPQDDNSVSMSGGSVHTEPEEVIIEENASIPFAEDMIVDEIQLTDKFEESNISEQENALVSSEIVAEETTTLSEEIVTEEVSEENIQFSETVQIAENISEDSQPKSDEERAFVAENEGTQRVDDQSQDMDCMAIENQEYEEQTFVQDEPSNLDTFKRSQVEEKIEESNIVNSIEKICETVSLQEETDKMEYEYETTVPSDLAADYNANKEEMECKTIENNQGTQLNFSTLSKEEKEEIYDNLESKVAEMNLVDEKVEQKPSTIENKDEKIVFELVKNENIELVCKKEDISSKKSPIKRDKKVKKGVTKQPSTKKTKAPTSKVQKIDKEKKSEKPTKKPTKTIKPPTFKINKDKKPPEIKNKKNSNEKSTKKSKEKANLKEPDKLEKKTEKKLTKFEEALQCLAKVETEGEDIRRSSRIKSISVMNKKTSGWGLVKSKSETSLNDGDASDSNFSFLTESDKSTPTASPKVSSKDRKSKSGIGSSESLHQTPIKPYSQVIVPFKNECNSKGRAKDPVVEARLKQFVHLKENLYKTDRMICKEAKKMACDCFLTPEELDNSDYYGCGEDCLNRLLLIECGNLCTVGDRCTNKRFQKNFFAPVEVFNTDKKGLGLRAAANIPFGEFILEYVGEVLNSAEFDKRAEVYSQDKNIHYYFMALRADAIIDATMKGNISRFINHSCDPNAETQKWTVNGELRIGFFSTRTILAGEEITFDYRFQRYGKEAQKCFCGASICRGWLGEQPDSDEEEEEEEEEIEETKPGTPIPPVTLDDATPSDLGVKVEDESILEITSATPEQKDVSPQIPSQDVPVPAPPRPAILKKKVQKKKSRIEMFEEVDQLNEEIEMVVTTGLKNQAHTLKLSRLMVRAKEPQQRAKLLRVLRRGELPCRRLFLDYHGLRLMHGYMIDAQQLVASNKKFESLRLEMLQTLAVLPIPNKTMLQDSKVLPTVEKWSTNKDLTSPEDSESNSPKDAETPPKPVEIKEESKEPIKEEGVLERTIEDQQEEIRFLATKLLEEWKNLKEVFRIPKKERIEQMKEHEREANKKFMQTNQNTYGSEEYKKMDRYRGVESRGKFEREQSRKPRKPGDKPSAEFLRLSRVERRKLFALQHELKEEERKLKQREMWRQHEMNCMMIGADPRFTAPFDPSRGYQYIWNQQIGQWQTVPIQDNPRYPSQPAAHQLPNLNLPQPAAHQLPNLNLPQPAAHQLSNLNLPQPAAHQLPNLNLPPPHMAKPPLPAYQYPSPINLQMPPLTQNPVQGHLPPLPQTSVPGHMPSLSHNPVQGHMPPLPQNPVHGQLPPLPGTTQIYHSQPQISIPTPPPLAQIPLPQHQIDEDPSQVKFMGPIPPPVKLPPKWKCAKDKYGRPYYYHIKLRRSQWEPPPPPEPVEVSESESSSESSTVSSDSSSENSDSDDDVDDTKLLIEVRRQMDSLPKVGKSLPIDPENMDDTPTKTPSPDEKHFESDMDDIKQRNLSIEEDIIRRPSIDMRLKELDLFKDDRPAKKKRRVGLCEEIIISPRTEEDKKQFKEDLKRYKANKEKLKRQKEKILMQTKKQLREIELKKAKEKRVKTTVKVKLKEKPDFNSEAAKKIKETFRTNMASTVVSSLNAYRKPDCTEGRITNTQDFKHLARKLTHFVMLKEMKHITKIEDLTCTDNVKVKAREFIRKYMSKFGEVYVKRSDSPDFKD